MLRGKRKQQVQTFLNIADMIEKDMTDKQLFQRSVRKLQAKRDIADTLARDSDEEVARIGRMMGAMIDEVEMMASTAIYEVAFQSAGKAGELRADIYIALQLHNKEVKKEWQLI